MALWCVQICFRVFKMMVMMGNCLPKWPVGQMHVFRAGPAFLPTYLKACSCQCNGCRADTGSCVGLVMLQERTQLVREQIWAGGGWEGGRNWVAGGQAVGLPAQGGGGIGMLLLGCIQASIPRAHGLNLGHTAFSRKPYWELGPPLRQRCECALPPGGGAPQHTKDVLDIAQVHWLQYSSAV